MRFGRILIANRGEIAIRVARAARDLGIESVAVYSDDDSESLHVKIADSSCRLEGAGVGAYLNGQGVVDAAKEAGCDAVHPGYGFLSENADFSRFCSELACNGQRSGVRAPGINSPGHDRFTRISSSDQMLLA